jgi:hypothetical protein
MGAGIALERIRGNSPLNIAICDGTKADYDD